MDFRPQKPVVCPLCKCRISEWMIAAGKTVTIRYDLALLRADETVHKSCYTDFWLCNGHNYGEHG